MGSDMFGWKTSKNIKTLQAADSNKCHTGAPDGGHRSLLTLSDIILVLSYCFIIKKILYYVGIKYDIRRIRASVVPIYLRGSYDPPRTPAGKPGIIREFI